MKKSQSLVSGFTEPCPVEQKNSQYISVALANNGHETHVFAHLK